MNLNLIKQVSKLLAYLISQLAILILTQNRFKKPAKKV